MKIFSDSKKSAIAIFSIISIIFGHPILNNIWYWGTQDWDFFEYNYGLARETLLEYHQLPLWSPYLCGGFPLLGHPQSPVAAPSFIFPLIFGPVLGIKIQIFFFLFLGLYGMWLVSRHLGLRGFASYLPSFLFMLSSIYPLTIVGGNFQNKTIALVPWVTLFFLKSKNPNLPKSILLSALMLALIFLEGDAYLFFYTLLFLVLISLFRLLEKNKIHSVIQVFVFVVFLSMLIGAVKFLPVFELYQKNNRVTDTTGGYTLHVLKEALSNRNQMHFSDHGLPYYEDYGNPTAKSFIWGDRAFGWDENGAYVGILPIIIFILGSLLFFRKNWMWSTIAFVFLWLSFGDRTPASLWNTLHAIPPFSSLRIPTRFRVFFVFCLAIVVGKTLSELDNKLRRKFLRGSLITNAIVTIILFDLILVNSPVFKEAFTISPPTLTRNVLFQQSGINPMLPKVHDGTYVSFLQNIGNVNCLFSYAHFGIQHYAIPRESKDYKGEIFLENTTGIVKITYFSPNEVKTKIQSLSDGFVVLNQNYFDGWKIKGKNITKAQSYNGLIAVPIPKGEHIITFYYLPDSFTIGGFLTLTSSILTICAIVKFRQ